MAAASPGIVVVQGCTTPDLGPVEPMVQSGMVEVIHQNGTDLVDLLVLVDNSNSMAQEQDNLARNFPYLIDQLTVARDADGNGRPDNAVVQDLHIGVISTDMGTGGYAVTSCDEPLGGDDGELLHEPSELVANCASGYPSYLEWNEGDDAEAIAADFACIATLGTGGCGFEQQLGAIRKALTVHAGGANAGFLRDDSLLAILIVTDEEDCSIRTDTPNATDIYNTQLPLGVPNLRCFRHADQYVEPVENFVRDILALRAGQEDRLVVAGIVGIPPDTGCNLTGMSDADYQCLLDDPKMQEVIDNSQDGGGERLTPSCDVPGLGEAFPPRRIVEFIRQVSREAQSGIVQSICETDFGPAIQAITRLIQTKIRGACLGRPLDPDRANQVRCVVQETLPTSDGCGTGRIDLGLADNQRVCQICQKGDGESGRLVDELGQDLAPCAEFNAAGDYWEYVAGDDPASACPGRGELAFRGDTTPADDSTVRLECLSRVGEE